MGSGIKNVIVLFVTTSTLLVLLDRHSCLLEVSDEEYPLTNLFSVSEMSPRARLGANLYIDTDRRIQEGFKLTDPDRIVTFHLVVLIVCRYQWRDREVEYCFFKVVLEQPQTAT